MKTDYRVVIIGGGVVGASVAYHLAKGGWTDIAILERSVLTAGSSWHAAGGFHALNADPNIAALQAYTIDLLTEVGRESGIDIGMHMTGGITVASAPERWQALKASYRIFQSLGIDDVELIGPEEIKARCPILNVDGLKGGLWSDREGHIDPSAVVHAYARAAKLRGADIVEHTMVTGLTQRGDGIWLVETDKGTIRAEHVVNAGGLWAKKVGMMAGVDLPVSPLEHHYLVTESIPELVAMKGEIPLIVDPEGFTYVRQEQKGLLMGIYETSHTHWHMEGAPWDFGVELLQEDIGRISNELDIGFRRFPCMNTAGVKRWVNGAFTFSPDGNPLVGPVRGIRNYWVACGVMAGFLQGGGVGKSLAEWMIDGAPQADIFGMDIARYGQIAENREYIRQTTGQFYSRRFVMTFPNEVLPAGRTIKAPGAHAGMTAAGCRWMGRWGLEMPLYFAPEGFVEELSLTRSNATPIIAAECKAAREGVALLDITGFSRYEVTGPGAEAWLDRLFASRLPKPGRSALAPMLAETGKLKGDLTILNWGGGRYWIMGSYYLRQWHMRWFEDHMGDGVALRDISDDIGGFALIGPKSRDVLQALTHQDVSNAALPFMSCQTLDLGLLRTRVNRMSVAGELGYEINCHALEHSALRDMLLKAGQGAIREIGFQALLSLRLEKSFGIWSAEFTQGYTPGATGMDRFIAWNKGDFIGRDAATQERANPSAQVLVTLEVEAKDADASGYEPVWQDGRRVGFITSGGYGHTVGKSLAMAMVDREAAEPGTALTTHVIGEEVSARVIAPSPYDPQGRAMRA